MNSILGQIPKPSRYLGIEEGAIHKDINTVSVHIALAFPDMYEIAMSYLGQKILYSIVNARPKWWAERVFAPCKEAGELLVQEGISLSSLESTTPLRYFNLIGFSLTHDMCYTTMLYMLDIAHIPFYVKERDEQYPLLIAGGSSTFNPSFLGEFFDIIALGEGEELIVDILECYEQCKEKQYSKKDTLEALSDIDGVLIPTLQEEGKKYIRRAVQDLNTVSYPTEQVVPFGAVHNRLALEIARGCTRGCRFCQAGVIYRPLRERTIDALEGIISESLEKTGYDEVSFLSLSTGDFSALRTLFHASSSKCTENNVALAMPSQRVGSIDESIFKAIASVRKTGATLAPEAGSQRLRDVICKGVTEAELLEHARILAQYGWQKLKLYFMIGLPTETAEDRDAIVELAKKVRYVSNSKMEVTISLSPYVPKAHTPFQWEQQVSREDFESYIRLFKHQIQYAKGISLRWHNPAMSMIEGVFARGDIRLAPVLVEAYKRGSLFPSWNDQFSEVPYLEALEQYGLSVEEFLRERSLEENLPWDCVEIGVSKAFLLRERENAYKAKVVEDCHYNACLACEACDTPYKASLLQRGKNDSYTIITNFAKRDQVALTLPQEEEYIPREYTEEEKQQMRAEKKARKEEERQQKEREQKQREEERKRSAGILGKKAQLLRVWHTKLERSAYLSQLELQEYFFRMLRRAGIETSFSQGFSPSPLITFGRALPVGMQSHQEWFSIFVRSEYNPEKVKECLNCSIEGIDIITVEELALKTKLENAYKEDFMLCGADKTVYTAFKGIAKQSSAIYRYTHKDKERSIDIAPILYDIRLDDTILYFSCSWEGQYISPQKLLNFIMPCAQALPLVKVKQYIV